MACQGSPSLICGPQIPDVAYHLVQNKGMVGEISENPLWEGEIGTGRLFGQIICRTDRWTDPLIYGVSAGHGWGKGTQDILGQGEQERQREITGRGTHLN